MVRILLLMNLQTFDHFFCHLYYLFSAYLKKGDYNVIVVDWSKYTLHLYGWAATHVSDVGKYTAKMVDFMEAQGVNLHNTTLVGHSLGAHVMGLAGYYAKGTVNYVVGRYLKVNEYTLQNVEFE